MDVELQHELSGQTHSVRPTSPKKRPFDEIDDTTIGSLSGTPVPSTGVAVQIPQTQCKEENSLPKTNATDNANAQPWPSNPLPSSTSTITPSNTSLNSPSNTASTMMTPSNTNKLPNPSTPFQLASHTPSKKQKLSPTSKEAKEQEKAKKEEARKLWEEEKRKREEEKKRKEEEKEEEKRRREEMKRKKDEEKEEEKRKREEEKKKKDEEREAERRKREEKKKQKEEERLAREEEKKKKERSQMRLNAFFAKPPVPKSPSEVPITDTSSNKDTTEEPGQPSANESNDAKVTSDYEKDFPQFFVKSHMRVASAHRFQRDPEALLHVREKLDTCLKNKEAQEDPSSNQMVKPSELFNIIPYKRRCGQMKTPPVKEILAAIHNSDASQGAVIDLTSEDDAAAKRISQVRKTLNKIPMKLLQFKEDVRPPYRGTFTKRLPEKSAFKLCRNPFSRSVPEFNYDYDSEAEWEEPEEGEDLDSEGEEDASEDEEEDMDDFLDDKDDEIGKRKMIVGDLEPVSSGICWANGNGANDLLKCYQMETLLDTFSFPIDPFSDAYWKKPSPQNGNFTNTPVYSKAIDNARQALLPLGTPYRGPMSSPALLIPQVAYRHTGSTVVGPNQKPRARFPSDLIPEFKQVISGSDLTKAGLIEILKKRFPKVSKEVIKDTLTATAVRQGLKEADKRWVLIENSASTAPR